MDFSTANRPTILALAIIAVAVFSFAGVLGPVHIGMMGDSDMHTCPFMQSALCSMDAIGHISEWQAVFASIVQTSGSVVAMLLLALGALVSFILFAPQNIFEVPAFSRVRLRQRAVLQSSIVSPLLAALSQGILNPKTF